MIDGQFWALMGLTVAFHGLMVVIAVLIYRRQQAFFEVALGKIDGAVVGIEKDLHDPLMMQALCKTMLDDLETRIATKMRLSLQGMLGTAQQQIAKVGGHGAGNKFMAALHVLGSKNKLKAAKEMAPLLFGDGNAATFDGPGSLPASQPPGIPDAVAKMNEYMQGQLTPEQIAAGNAKAKELGLI